nr:hypothetical protein [Tanacetum cinerariifolium]
MCQSNQQVNVVNPSCVTCGGPHHYFECQVSGGFTQGDVYAATRNYNAGANKMKKIEKYFYERPQGVLLSNIVPNLREHINLTTTRTGLTTAEPSIPPPVSPTPREEVEKEPKTLMDEVHITSPTSTAHVPPLGIQPVLMDALTQISKYSKVLRDLLKDKEKLEELANIPINVECFAILLNKVHKKLGDPRKETICALQNLYTTKALVDLYEEKLTLRIENEELVFRAEKALRYPSKYHHFVHSIDTVDSSSDNDTIHDKLRSGSTTSYSDSLKGRSFPNLKELECFLNRDPSIDSSSKNNIEMIDSIFEEFIDKLSLVDTFPLGNDDDLFCFENDNEEWRNLLYQDPFDDTPSEKGKIKN